MTLGALLALGAALVVAQVVLDVMEEQDRRRRETDAFMRGLACWGVKRRMP